jgi:catalase (peroxidase I)
MDAVEAVFGTQKRFSPLNSWPTLNLDKATTIIMAYQTKKYGKNLADLMILTGTVP